MFTDKNIFVVDNNLI